MDKKYEGKSLFLVFLISYLDFILVALMIKLPLVIPMLFILICIFLIFEARKERQFYVNIDKEKSVKFILLSALIALFTGMILFIQKGNPFFILFFLIILFVPVIYSMFLYFMIIKEEKQDPRRNVACLIFMSVIFYIAYSKIWISSYRSFFVILIICAIHLALFQLINFLFWMAKEKKTNIFVYQKSSEEDLIRSMVLGLFLPITGLMINGYFGDGGQGGLFGNFSHPLFYIIGVLNGFSLLLPEFKNQKLNLFAFFLRSVGYTYVLYFMIVFIPLLPVGLIGLLIVLGIYIFAPALLVYWQGKVLINNYTVLKKEYGKMALAGTFLVGLLTIPIVLSLSVINDRANLDRAFLYVYDNPENRYEDINLPKLKKTLSQIETTSSKNFYRGFLHDEYSDLNYIPILTDLYRSSVLENQTLTKESLNKLKVIFFNEHRFEQTTISRQESSVKLRKITSTTNYDSDLGAYRTWIDLELKSGDNFRSEYYTTFTLPEGVYVSDYYLYVEDEKKMGILADERAAAFIYQKIVSASQDPGILHYVGENQLELKVFPFDKNEKRQTGFELIHKGPFEFEIDGKTVSVKGDAFTEIRAVNSVLLNREIIKTLPEIHRKPQYHIIIDASEDSDLAYLRERFAEPYILENGLEDAPVYFTSYKVEESNYENLYQNIKQKGGFNLSLAINHIFNTVAEGEFPVMIVISENYQNAVLPTQSPYELYPESPSYYVLDHGLKLKQYNFNNNEEMGVVAQPVIVKAYQYENVAVGDSLTDQVVILGNMDEIEFTNNQYVDAITLRALDYQHRYDNKNNIISSVRDSFEVHVLNQSTAFIVVETKEQEKELFDYQSKLLKNNFIEDTPTRNLAEPSVYVVFIFAGCILILILVNKNFRRFLP